MKYVIIIADGAADYGLAELDGQTPLEAAHAPNTDRISREGHLGTVATTPTGFACGSDICCMSLLGYDPARFHTGRAPLEAAALGINLAPTDWIFRVNLVTVVDGQMRDHSAGHIPDDQARPLVEQLAAELGLGIDSPLVLYPGVSYRNIMVDRANVRDWSTLQTTPPHDIPDQPMQQHLPTGSEHAPLLRELIEDSHVRLRDHPINENRRSRGLPGATHLWPWGQGTRPNLEDFRKQFGVRGAMITAVDLLAGLAVFIGWDCLDVPGQTSYHDTDYATAGHYAIEALIDYDLVCVHVESPDEAAHAADVATKVEAIEAIDQHVVGPILDALSRIGPDHRILYLPDHYTSAASRKHDATPVPFAMCGKSVAGAGGESFDEIHARSSNLHFQHGHELMPHFLFGGLS